MLGICEAMLYTMRLYAVIIDASNQPELMSQQRTRLESMLNVVGHGYDADFLMRRMMPMMHLLFDAFTAVTSIYDHLSSDVFASLATLCSLDFHPPIAALLSSHLVDNIEKIHTPPTVVYEHLRLRNHVSMPAIGLGTWLLEGDICKQVPSTPP